MSDGLAIQNRRITKPDFRPCSTHRSRSQAPFYLCARKPDCQPGRGYLGTPPLPFRRRPPQSNCPLRTVPRPGSRAGVRTHARQGWCFIVGSPRAGTRGSRPPTYATHAGPKPNTKLQLRFTGSFRLAAGMSHLHDNYSFTESLVETVLQSLRHSCRSELTRQGISLP